MNWDRIEGNWRQFKRNVMRQWGRLREAYGISKQRRVQDHSSDATLTPRKK
jgi:hypothetical protein